MITPKRFILLWGAGTLLAGLATFWGVRLLITGDSLFSSRGDLLPKVQLSAEAQAFVRSLPVLSKNASPLALSGMSPRMQIPRLGVDSPLVELAQTETSWFIDGLEQRIGHLQGTDAPGGIGNTVFAGHITLADNSPGPFAEMDHLLPGDRIYIIGAVKQYVYEVTMQQEVAEDRLEVAYPTNQPQLTLITCARWSWLEGRYTMRQVVTARLIEKSR